MKIILYILIVNLSFLNLVHAKKKTKVQIKSSSNLLLKKRYLPKKYSVSMRVFFANAGLQSGTAPYRVGVLNNQGIGATSRLEYRYNSLLSLSVGLTYTSSKKSGEEGYFHKDLTDLKISEYKIDNYIMLNLSTGMTLLRPYLKFGIGYGDLSMNFNPDNEGFSDLNDSIVGVTGDGLVADLGVGLELLFYRGLGIFMELSYNTFDVGDVKYDIQSELAAYEKSLVSSTQGSKFDGFNVKYGINLRF